MANDIYSKFKKSAVIDDAKYEQFPDGYNGDIVVGSTKELGDDAEYGARFIVEFESLDGKNVGSMSCPMGSKYGAARSIATLKAFWVACLGFDPKVPAEVEKSGVNGDEAEDIAKAALKEDLFRGHVVRARVAHVPNKKFPDAKDFVNFSFKPVLENGEPKKVK